MRILRSLLAWEKAYMINWCICEGELRSLWVFCGAKALLPVPPMLRTSGCSSHCHHPDYPSRRSSWLLFLCTYCPLLSFLRTIQPHWLLGIDILSWKFSCLQLLLPEGIVLSMQRYASAAFSLSLIMIFPMKGHLSCCLCLFINVCEAKSSLIIMKTITETPPG